MQEHSKNGNFSKKKTFILSRYMSCPWAGTMFAEYIRLLVSRLGLPSEYDYWLAEYSPIIPQKSITTNMHISTCPIQSTLTSHCHCYLPPIVFRHTASARRTFGQSHSAVHPEKVAKEEERPPLCGVIKAPPSWEAACDCIPLGL